MLGAAGATTLGAGAAAMSKAASGSANRAFVNMVLPGKIRQLALAEPALTLN
jgi:hypothetical protein